MKEYLNLLYFLISNEEIENIQELVIKLKGLFLNHYEEMDINLFYLSKQLLIKLGKDWGIEYEDIIPLEKEINSMDDFVTKLQIPKITFIWNRIESNMDVYRKESELYWDIRKILLNKDKYVRNYKPIINYYLSLIINAIDSELENYEFQDNKAEIFQFKEIIRMSKLMLSTAEITEHKHVSLTIRNHPSRIARIAENYK